MSKVKGLIHLGYFNERRRRIATWSTGLDNAGYDSDQHTCVFSNTSLCGSCEEFDDEVMMMACGGDCVRVWSVLLILLMITYNLHSPVTIKRLTGVHNVCLIYT